MRNKIVTINLSIVMLLVLTAGCLTTTQKSSGIGTGVGAALGVGIGVIVGDPLLGAAIGAGAGALGGALVGDHMDKKREEAEKADMERQLELEQKAGSGEGQNYIDAHYEYVKKRKWVDTSKKERVWVEERVEGDRRIEGHYENRLVPSGYWEEHEEKTWVPAHHE